jgi:hypothetical protein
VGEALSASLALLFFSTSFTSGEVAKPTRRPIDVHMRLSLRVFALCFSCFIRENSSIILKDMLH